MPGAFAAGSDEIRVGVIGCGGRGTGAIGQRAQRSRRASGSSRWETCFRIASTDSLEESDEARGQGRRARRNSSSPAGTPTRRSSRSDVNYVILATPPGFRPTHLQAAIAAGKNVFTEKPVAVDAAGYKTVVAAADVAKQKGLGVVAGTQRRHHAAYREAMKRLHDGAIGDIVAIRAYWNQGGLWNKPREASWTDMECQLRNWLYYTWLSGDHIVEQHVHNLDVGNWGMNGIPVRVFGVGGRQARTAPEYGHIFDHFGLDYEYANGVHMQSMCRQMPGTPGLVAEAFVGTKGTMDTQDGRRYEITRPERVEVVGRVHGSVPAGAHGPDREHPCGQATQRAEAGGRQHADRHLRTRVRLHRQGGRLRPVPRDRSQPLAGEAGFRPDRRRRPWRFPAAAPARCSTGQQTAGRLADWRFEATGPVRFPVAFSCRRHHASNRPALRRACAS